MDETEKFLAELNRKGKIRVTRCTYQERYAVVEVLLRLDIDGPPHENPDGFPGLRATPTRIPRRLRVRWARPVPPEFSNTRDLVQTFRDFLRFCNVRDIPDVQRGVI